MSKQQQQTTAITAPSHTIDLRALTVGDPTRASTMATFDPATPDGMEMLFKTLASPSLNHVDSAGEVLEIVHWHAQATLDVSGGDGEPRPGVRVTLFTPTGDTFTFAGFGPHSSFHAVRQIFGDGPWAPPLKLKVKPFATASGNQSYLLIPVTPPPGPRTKEANAKS